MKRLNFDSFREDTDRLAELVVKELDTLWHVHVEHQVGKAKPYHECIIMIAPTGVEAAQAIQTWAAETIKDDQELEVNVYRAQLFDVAASITTNGPVVDVEKLIETLDEWADQQSAVNAMLNQLSAY